MENATRAQRGTRKGELSDAKRALLEKRLRGEWQIESDSIPRRSSGTIAPLSFAQQRLWFLDQFSPGNPFYSESTAVRLPFELDVPAFERAFNEIVRRHEALRTRYPSQNGEPVQLIDPFLLMPLPIADLSSLPAASREAEAIRLAGIEATQPFELASGPLIRVSLVRMDATDYLFLLSMHHIICDGWSMEVFFKELSALYDAFSQGLPSPLPELPIQYADFAIWQRQWLSGRRLASQLAYWKKQLAGVNTLELPTDFPRPPVPSFEGASKSFVLTAGCPRGREGLSAAARSHFVHGAAGGIPNAAASIQRTDRHSSRLTHCQSQPYRDRGVDRVFREHPGPTDGFHWRSYVSRVAGASS